MQEFLLSLMVEYIYDFNFCISFEGRQFHQVGLENFIPIEHIKLDFRNKILVNLKFSAGH